ncbi:uncharacterized protein [Henckelia pumila]|uniref:uncharacterized protein n=1 Tax=Henckelia pumila TaxID=405737 RepID=UPI003C6DD556
MEFQSLTRRELQSLCKRNNIPANITNVAMADALKSLKFVEGIEEMSQPNESESAQSSIESPAKSEVTSPYVPPTGGRTTRQRTIAKEEPQTLGPMTRTRGTARKTHAKNKEESRADATETPAVAAQPSRRRVPVTSALRKMESQFKECAEEDEKKGVPLTPVALEVTSRRRGLNKESEARRVYNSTRRSARLAEKNVEISSEVKNEKPEILRSDLFIKEEDKNVEMNVKEVSIGVHEVSEITGVEVETSLEENFKKMDGTEVSSGGKQDIPDENDESKLESNVEEKLSQNSELDDHNLEMDQCIDAGDEQLSVHCETGSELDGDRADETETSNGGNVAMTLDESNVEETLSQQSETDEPNPEMDLCIDAGVEQSNVLYETGLELNGERTDETEPSMTLNESNVEEILSQQSETDEPNPEIDLCIDAGVEQSSALYETGSALNAERANETEPSIGVNVATTLNENNDFEDGDDDVKQDEVGKENETNPTSEVDNEVQQASEEELVRDKIAAEEEVSESVLASINCQLNCSKSAAVDSPLRLNADFHEINVEERQDDTGDEKESNPIEETECGQILCHEFENLLPEASEKADSPSSDAVDIKNSPIKHFGGLEGAATVHSPVLNAADFLKEINTSGIEFELGSSMPLKSLTPTKKSASKPSATKKKIADVSDNKENIGSCGSKLVLKKERVKIAKDIAEKSMDLNDFSMRSKLVLKKERVKIAKDIAEKSMDLNDFSMRKLTKMLKERLQITNKSSEDENGNKATTRPALQALPENKQTAE